MSRALSLSTKLASALLALDLIPYDDAKAMGKGHFLSLWNFDHNIRHAENGPLEFWNLTPMLIPAHRRKTAQVDLPAIAKNKDVRTSEAIHQAALASKRGDYHGAAHILATAPKKRKPKVKIANRGFQKGHRPFKRRRL